MQGQYIISGGGESYAARHNFSELRRLERAITHAARALGYRRPDLYGIDPDTWTGNCLDPAAIGLYFRVPARDIPEHLRATARRMCQSVVQSQNKSDQSDLFSGGGK